MEYASSTLRRLQLTELEILIEIDRVCRELDISYFLDGGTLLGAARHEGFIPWDDDVDIGMVRNDYDVFLSEGPNIISDEYEICFPGKTEGYAPMFAKVVKRGTVFETAETKDSGFAQGVFVDIFPYDAVASDMSTAQQQRKVCRRKQTLSYLYHSGHAIPPHGGVLGSVEKAVLRAAHGFCKVFLNDECLRDDFDRWARIGEKRHGGGIMSYVYPVGDVGVPIESVLPVKPIVFEGITLSGPAVPEALLCFYYGDNWSELPPESERKNHAPLRLEL